MSIDFIHCNRCLLRYSTQVVFHLTECAKIFCQTCVQTTPTKTCPNCYPNMCQTLPLVSGIKHDIEVYFKDICSSFKKLSNAELFQKAQRKHLFQALLNKIKVLENQNCQLRAQLNHLENELKKKDNQINSLKCENNQLKSTINSTVNNMNESDNYSNYGALSQQKTENKVSFSKIFGLNNENQIRSNGSITQTKNQFASTSTNTSLARMLNRNAEPGPSPTPTTRSRITLSQDCSNFGSKVHSEEWQRREHSIYSYTPMSTNSIRSRGSANINTPFSLRSYTSTSHTPFRTVSPMIFGFKPSKVIQKVSPYSPF